MNVISLKIRLVFLFILIVNCAIAQTVKGIISGEEGPLPGVSIVEKGTTNGSISDFDGNYSIDLVDSNSVLVFTFLGFTTKEIVVGDQTSIDVVLEKSIENLDEIVLIGYNQTQSKRTLSTAISEVDAKQIEDLPVARVENILQGSAAGVIVQQDSGAPGSSSSVRIRRVGSPNNSDPLYVVDGFPVPDLKFLNPNDIKELVVLKDAASTSVSGSRGSNGVILVKTKSGRKYSQPVISINGYSGFQFMGDKPDLMSASEYINYYNQGVVEAGSNLNGNRGAFTEAERNALPNTDWYDTVTSNAPINNLAVSLSGSGENSNAP